MLLKSPFILSSFSPPTPLPYLSRRSHLSFHRFSQFWTPFFRKSGDKIMFTEPPTGIFAVKTDLFWLVVVVVVVVVRQKKKSPLTITYQFCTLHFGAQFFKDMCRTRVSESGRERREGEENEKRYLGGGGAVVVGWW